MIIGLFAPFAIFAIFVFIKFGLQRANILSNIVFYTCFFLLLHLLFNVLLDVDNSESEGDSNNNSNYFAATIMSMITILIYIIVGLLPFLRYLVYPLKYLPYSSVWLDHFIANVPISAFYVFTVYILKSINYRN